MTKTAKQFELERMMETPGWKYFSKYLRDREVILIKNLRSCKETDIKTYRGRLKELESIKSFLKVELLSGSALFDAMEEMDNQISAHNSR